jgi:hypothetical protein
MERLNFKKLSYLESKEWYQVKIVNRFGALENMVANVEAIRLCKSASTGVIKDLIYCLLYAGLDISTVVIKPNILAGYSFFKINE